MEKLLIKIKKLIPIKLFKTLQPVYHFLLSWFAVLIYKFPSEKLIVIGVTGTTGKTTSVYLIAKTLEGAGLKTGFTSTAMFNDGEKEWLNDKKMTMIGRFFTQRMLSRMVKNGCRYAIVETTSEGIRQFRHRFINYDVLIITGLYPEHIESHGSFENYKAAKGKLFEHLKRCKIKYIDNERIVHKGVSGLRKTDLTQIKKTIIANLDDEHAGYFLNFWAEKKIGYKKVESHPPAGGSSPLQRGLAEAGKVEGQLNNVIEYGDISVTQNGASFKAGKTKINLKLLGAFNVINAMNGFAVGVSQKLSNENIKKGLESIMGVAGRIEKIDEGQPYTVIVDYAFEPNAVKKLYETVRVIPHNKIIHVLGSTGGGRDISRRPILGKLAGENADLVIITNEDPYDDDPQIIIDQVAVGAEHAGKKLGVNLLKISDRREAITKALSEAKPNDIVLITGKGSEQAICVANGEKITWDDRGVVRGILGSKGK